MTVPAALPRSGGGEVRGLGRRSGSPDRARSSNGLESKLEGGNSDVAFVSGVEIGPKSIFLATFSSPGRPSVWVSSSPLT